MLKKSNSWGGPPNGGEEEILDGELMNWVNLNLDYLDNDYYNKEEGDDMLNSGPLR